MTNSRETIAVIIPVFNRKKSLEEALESVIAQSLPPDEIIVIDDGSTDDVINTLAPRYSSVIFERQANQGVSAARNRGIRRTNADWLAFLDSDDLWLPDKLEKQMKALAHQSSMQVCHTDEIWIRNGNRVNPKLKHAKQGGEIYEACLPLCAMSPSSIIIHRSVFDNVGLFDETLPACEDYDLWLRICARYEVCFVDKKLLIKQGGHDDQLSRKYWGMDRFRIQALCKILRSGELSATQIRASKVMLREKIRVYLLGAQKRNKVKEINYFKNLVQEFSLEGREGNNG